MAGIDPEGLLRATRRVGNNTAAVSRRTGPLAGWRKDERGVSPVIGTILILFIVLLAMAGILGWGVPAIQGLQDHAEFQSVLTQAIEFNQELRTARDRDSTVTHQFSMDKGLLAMERGSRLVVMHYANASFIPLNLSGWQPSSPATLDVTGLPANAVTNVSVDDMDGGTNGTRAWCPAPPTCSNLQLINATVNYLLFGNVTRIQFRNNTTVEAEAWILDVGRLVYRMKLSEDTNRIHMEMGAVMVQQGQAVFLQEEPALKEPVFTVTPKDTSYFVRLFELKGDSAVSGKGRHPLLAHLDDNIGVTRQRPLVNPVYGVRIMVDDGGNINTVGLLEEAYCNHLKLQANYVQQGGECDSGEVNVLYNPDDTAQNNSGKFAYEMNHAVVSINIY